MATDGDNDLTREVDVYFDFCQLEYGVDSCPAVLGEDSFAKCHNTLATCPVPDSYSPAQKPLTFVRPEDGVEANKIPSLKQLTIEASRLAGFTGKESPLGERGKAVATFTDHAWDDSLVDKYHLERPTGDAGSPRYDPLEVGTFWPKFRARNRYYIGRDFIVRSGIGSDVRDRRYVIEKMEGFNSNPKVVAKDPLKLADDDRAQCPVASSGRLATAINETDTSLTLQPSGIGDKEYPTSGRATIGKEYVAFDRSGDDITLTSRALNGESQEHDANDTFQLAHIVDGETAADIVYDLLVNFSPVPASAIPKADWDAEMTEIPNVYTTEIAKPTSVKKLIGELAEQAGFGIAWDDLRQEILLVAVKQPEESATIIDDDMIVADSVRVRDAQDKRISRVWTAFGQIDPVVDLDEDANYRQVAIDVETEAEDAPKYAQPKIRKIFSRWIPQFGLAVAQDLNSRLLARFQDVPRDIRFNLSRYDIDDIRLGTTRLLRTAQIQNRFGQPEDITVRILGIEEKEDILAIDAEEQLYIQPPAQTLERTVIISSDTNSFNLKAAHDNLYQPAEAGMTVRCIVKAGVFVCAETSDEPAFDTGRFADGVNIVLEIEADATISGRGGSGRDIDLSLYGRDEDFKYSFNQSNHPRGNPAGGNALFAADGVTLINNGTIQAGGGASSGFAGFVMVPEDINRDTGDYFYIQLAVLAQGGPGGAPFGLGGRISYSNTYKGSGSSRLADGYEYRTELIINGGNATDTAAGLGGPGDRSRAVSEDNDSGGDMAYVENETLDGGNIATGGSDINFIEQGTSSIIVETYAAELDNFATPFGSDGYAINGTKNVTFDPDGTGEVIGRTRD